MNTDDRSHESSSPSRPPVPALEEDGLPSLVHRYDPEKAMDEIRRGLPVVEVKKYGFRKWLGISWVACVVGVGLYAFYLLPDGFIGTLVGYYILFAIILWALTRRTHS